MSTDRKITISDDSIKLGQALKKSDLVQSGAEAKLVIQEGLVTVNGEVCRERGHKIKGGDKISFEGVTVTVESHDP